MVHKDILKRIKQIEIHTKRLLSGSLVGQSSSSVKGSGFEFDQIREYQQGDDVRFIDWKSTARLNKLMVRQYIEERSRCIIIAVDISGSSLYGSGKKSKYDVMAEVAAVLALVADYAKDRVSLLLFSDIVELSIPPNTGQKHIRYILEQLFSYRPKHTLTSVAVALEHVAKMKAKDVVLFLISDFMSAPFERALATVAKKYDLVAIRCLDKNELHMPNVGFLTLMDDETGKIATIDTRGARAPIHPFAAERLAKQNSLFNAQGIDLLDVESSQPYMQDMVTFFKKRMLY